MTKDKMNAVAALDNAPVLFDDYRFKQKGFLKSS